MDVDSETEMSEDFTSTQSDDSQSIDLLEKYTKDYKLHEFKLPTTSRIIDIPPPVSRTLTDQEFWTGDELPNIPVITEHLRNEGKLKKDHILGLLEQVFDVLCAEEAVLTVDAPVTVCGDVHGQFYDLLKLFEVGGDPAHTNYLFLGDYVDRGYFSMEVVILLFCLKLCHSDSFFLLRGNHECRHLTEYFTFKEECMYLFFFSLMSKKIK